MILELSLATVPSSLVLAASQTLLRSSDNVLNTNTYMAGTGPGTFLLFPENFSFTFLIFIFPPRV